eukprot:scaffold49_cov409-Prasinococcus_capsulatus_cf.AAC.32
MAPRGAHSCAHEDRCPLVRPPRRPRRPPPPARPYHAAGWALGRAGPAGPRKAPRRASWGLFAAPQGPFRWVAARSSCGGPPPSLPPSLSACSLRCKWRSRLRRSPGAARAAAQSTLRGGEVPVRRGVYAPPHRGGRPRGAGPDPRGCEAGPDEAA